MNDFSIIDDYNYLCRLRILRCVSEFQGWPLTFHLVEGEQPWKMSHLYRLFTDKHCEFQYISKLCMEYSVPRNLYMSLYMYNYMIFNV